MPEKLKIACDTPIFKNGDKPLLKFYKLISVLPWFSKLLKRIMYKRLYEFVIKNEVLYEKQFRFWAAHCVEHSILELVNSISNSFENGKLTPGICIDFSRTFDTVDHTIFLIKFNQYDMKINTMTGLNAT